MERYEQPKKKGLRDVGLVPKDVAVIGTATPPPGVVGALPLAVRLLV